MAVPTQKQFHRPILDIVRDRKSIVPRVQIRQTLVDRFALTEADLQEMVPSGAQTRFDNRVYWALSYLKRAGLLQAESPGRFTITAVGTELLSELTGDIETSYLQMLIDRLKQQAPSESVQTQQPSIEDEHPAISNGISVNLDDATPDEQIALTYAQLVEKLTDDLLENVMGMTPERFERLSLDLLENMGYGKPTHTGGVADGGVDGVITEDLLGLGKICIQAKQWNDSSVGAKEIRDFAGSLDMEGATKGVFITTSHFTSSAVQTARIISGGAKFIRLIDRDELLRLLIEHEVGVRTSFVVKTLDENYFAEEI